VKSQPLWWRLLTQLGTKVRHYTIRLTGLFRQYILY
jgi:hypothetical protein